MNTISNTIKKLRIFVQDHVRGSLLGDSLVNFLKALGVNDLLTYILYRQDRKHQSKTMEIAKNYFSAHAKELDAVCDLLADDFSKQVYQSAILYRQTRNPKDAPPFSRNDQYFVSSIVPLGTEEVFVDCGAFDGDTMKAFRKASHNRYKQIICFEPLEKYHRILTKRGKGKHVTAICAGVYKETTTLSFHDSGKGSAFVSDTREETSRVPVRAIDDTPECREATFIKMDVEGSELDALKGARETILRNRPKLAICLYHHHGDFIHIPNWIHSLVPEYKLYVRHHSASINETVLYAIPEESDISTK